jgi:hypothetical protein
MCSNNCHFAFEIMTHRQGLERKKTYIILPDEDIDPTRPHKK